MSRHKIFICCALFFSLFLLSGCQTAKGVAEGVGTTIAGTTTGAVKDTQGLFGAIMSLDDWIKRNLW